MHLTEREWNDKRDEFLCAFIASGGGVMGFSICVDIALEHANRLMNQLGYTKEEGR